MTNEKNPKDINTTANQQAENSASSSNTKPAISEEEKAEFKAEYKAKLKRIFTDLDEGKFTGEEYQSELSFLFKSASKFLSYDETEEIEKEVLKEFSRSSGEETEFEPDSSDSEDKAEEQPQKDKGKGKEKEEPTAEATPTAKLDQLIAKTKNHTFTELSKKTAWKSLVTKEASRAGKSVEQIEQAQIIGKVLGGVANVASYLSPVSLILKTAPRIYLESQKTKQIDKDDIIAELTNFNPGEHLKNEVIAGLEMIRGDIVDQASTTEKKIWELNEANRKITEEKEKAEQEGKKKLAEVETQKNQEAKEKAQIATDIKNKERELKSVNDQLKAKEKEFKELAKEKETNEKTLTDNIAKLTKEIEDIKGEIKNKLQAEQEQEKIRLKALNKAQKELLSKERVNIETLTEKHAELEKEAKTQQELNQVLETKITDYLKYLESLEAEKARDQAEYDRLNSSWQISQDQNTLLNNELSTLTSELTELKENLPKLQEDYEKLKAEHKELDRKESEARSSYELAQKQLEREERERTNDKQKADKIEKEKNRLDRVELKLNSRVRELEGKLEIETIKYDTEKHENQQKHQKIQANFLTVRDLNRDIINLTSQTQQLTSEKSRLEADKSQLATERDNWKNKYEKEEMKARIGLLANVLQGATDYLPIPKNYRELAKTSIQVGNAYLIIKDLPNWTYEALISIITLLIFFSLRALKRKFWPSQKVSNLEKALEKVIINTKNSVQEVKQIIAEPTKEPTDRQKEEPNIIEVEPENETLDKFSQSPKPVKPSNTKKIQFSERVKKKKVKPQSKTK